MTKGNRTYLKYIISLSITMFKKYNLGSYAFPFNISLEWKLNFFKNSAFSPVPPSHNQARNFGAHFDFLPPNPALTPPTLPSARLWADPAVFCPLIHTFHCTSVWLHVVGRCCCVSAPVEDTKIILNRNEF